MMTDMAADTHAPMTHLIFTDGSSLGNPGPGGWGAVLLLSGDRVFEIGGGEKHTTNNRMELMALIRGLERMSGEKGDLTIYLDSRYVERGARDWSHGWKKSGWQTKAKTDVENRDLWELLLALLEERKKLGNVTWTHVAGHVGIPGNERADEIATGFASGKDVELFEGDLEYYTVDILHLAVDRAHAAKRSQSKSRSRAKAYSYVSLVDGIVKRHTTWVDCEKRVRGVRGAKFKKALSPTEEQEIIKGWGISGDTRK